MRYPLIIGWKGNAGVKFHDEMTARVKHYETWNKKAVETEVFERCEARLERGESMDYELSRQHTINGETQLISLFEDDFEIEWYESE